ncbi:hypothetical protein [Paenibacillus xanthanilyticus]|uniref:Uncharacterized protein n=1 Tax=Paenibacillus xanthanilyticus TaxID=1783531 RepID=A0ABV8KA50_9BACL
MSYKALERVCHNGKTYQVGDDVPGLAVDEAQRLLDLNVIEGEADVGFGDLTPEQFEALGAAEQKAKLKELDIEAASNAGERQLQYVAWYEGK